MAAEEERPDAAGTEPVTRRSTGTGRDEEEREVGSKKRLRTPWR